MFSLGSRPLFKHHSAGGNSSCRWSARKAYTDLSGIRWRHQPAASNWSSDGWGAGDSPGSLAGAATSANYRIDPSNRIAQPRPFSRLLVATPGRPQ